MRYRVSDLAARCGLSVDTIRSYQAEGLLEPAERDGDDAWYDDSHVDQIDRINELGQRGLSLGAIRRVLAGELDAGEQALAAALEAPLPGEETAATFGLDELARRTGASMTLLEALEREGLLVPRADNGKPVYTPADEGAVHAGQALLAAGVPLSELLAVAREHDAAMRAVADRAVDLFARYIRDPIRAAAGDDDAAAQQMVDALRAMLPAVGDVVSHHFRRRLLGAARERIIGTEAPALSDGQ